MRNPPAHGLSEKAVTVARIAGVVRAGVISVPFALLAVPLLVREMWLAVALVAAVVVALLLFQVVIRPPIWGRLWRYEIGEHELYLQHGWLTVSRQLIPLVRIQNVDTSQGPLERYFGLSSVTVSTAGGVVAIPSLDEEVAGQLRTRIAERVKAKGGLDE